MGRDCLAKYSTWARRVRKEIDCERDREDRKKDVDDNATAERTQLEIHEDEVLLTASFL